MVYDYETGLLSRCHSGSGHSDACENHSPIQRALSVTERTPIHFVVDHINTFRYKVALSAGEPTSFFGGSSLPADLNKVMESLQDPLAKGQQNTVKPVPKSEEPKDPEVKPKSDENLSEAISIINPSRIRRYDGSKEKYVASRGTWEAVNSARKDAQRSREEVERERVKLNEKLRQYNEATDDLYDSIGHLAAAENLTVQLRSRARSGSYKGLVKDIDDIREGFLLSIGEGKVVRFDQAVNTLQSTITNRFNAVRRAYYVAQEQLETAKEASQAGAEAAAKSADEAKTKEKDTKDFIKGNKAELSGIENRTFALSGGPNPTRNDGIINVKKDDIAVKKILIEPLELTLDAIALAEAEAEAAKETAGSIAATEDPLKASFDDAQQLYNEVMQKNAALVTSMINAQAIYDTVKNASFRVSRPFIAEGDEITIKAVITETVDDNGGTNANSATQTLEKMVVVDVDRAPRINYSTGVVFSSLINPQYDAVPGEENGTYHPREIGRDRYARALGVMIHSYWKNAGSIQIAGTFGIGTRVSDNANDLQFFVGPSLAFGRNRRAVLSVGWAAGNVTKLKDGVTEGTVLRSTEIPTVTSTKVRRFIGFTYNLS